MSNVIPLGITHADDCKCRRCLNAAYQAAKVTVSETTTRYQSIRTSSANAVSISRARQQWAEARQVLVLAEHALRTAEDEDRIEQRENRRVDAMQWNPKVAR